MVVFRDIVKSLLKSVEQIKGRVSIKIERTIFEPSSDEFTVRVTSKPEEVKSLLETGFDHVCKKDELVFLRKRK